MKMPTSARKYTSGSISNHKCPTKTQISLRIVQSDQILRCPHEETFSSDCDQTANAQEGGGGGGGGGSH